MHSEEAMDFMYKDTDPQFLENIWKEHPELYGRPEIWKPITGNIIHNIKEGVYFVSTYGRVFSLLRNKFLKEVETENGYFRVFLVSNDGSRRYHLLHRIVYMAFYPIIDAHLYQVNHKDGIKSHNWFWNLEWMTCSENRIHAIQMGLVKVIGEEHPMHIISEKTADDIGRLLSTTNFTAKEIANIVQNGATERIAYNIMNGNSWPAIYDKYNLSSINRNPSVLSEKQIHGICKFFEDYKINNPVIKFGQREYILIDALKSVNAEVNESTRRLAERLYYKLTHKDICNLYNY